VVGGALVDSVGWRGIFWVNIPVGIAAMAVIAVTMPKRPYRQEHSIDWLGAAVLALGTTALLLGLVWGGREYSWGAPEVLGALVAASGLLALFWLIERRVQEPILPFDLLRNQTVASSVACMFLVGAAMFGTISFVPLFVQGVIGTSATSSGVVLTPLMLGAVTTSFLSGQVVSRTGRYRPNTLIGPVLLGIGELLLWRMDVHTTNGEAARNMVIAGIGLGMMMQIFVLSIQNSVASRQMGSATALSQFARSIGATLGVTLMGVIVNQRLPAGADLEGTTIHRLPLAGREALANALHPAFLLAAVLCAGVFVISLLWVREVPLRSGVEDEPVYGDETSPQPGTTAAVQPRK
jgi:predicted MFS family arabinose efflux permease